MGNKDAKNLITFEYCGGWGYRKHCISAIDMIEQKYKGQFEYHLYMDPGVTGRLEVTVFIGTKDTNTDGIILHSKAASKKYISQAQE